MNIERKIVNKNIPLKYFYCTLRTRPRSSEFDDCLYGVQRTGGVYSDMAQPIQSAEKNFSKSVLCREERQNGISTCPSGILRR